ncbi:MAG: YbjQ family protein [Sandaracinaceae bacterium]|jgi:uncharacterized protein YbjQ (UPF0145 family)|nr:YbjQ family protein [Sandaracinaceae bacterium]
MTSGPYRSGVEQTSQIVVTTTNDVEGFAISSYLGIVRGIVVRSPSFGAGFVGSMKSLAGGNIGEFAAVCEAARHDAYQQMLEHAASLGANGIVGMRYDANEFQQGATEVLAYGTAVFLAPRTRSA